MTAIVMVATVVMAATNKSLCDAFQQAKAQKQGAAPQKMPRRMLINNLIPRIC
jgi:hypothetical protein